MILIRQVSNIVKCRNSFSTATAFFSSKPIPESFARRFQSQELRATPEARSVLQLLLNDKENSSRFQTSRSNGIWKSSAALSWPSQQEFQSQGNSKKLAETALQKQILSYLKEVDILDKSFKPKWEKLNAFYAAVDVEDLQEIKRMYPQALGSLSNMIAMARDHLKDSSLRPNLRHEYKNRCLWKCTLSLTWPHSMQFMGFGPSKAEASSWASLLALLWLKNENYIKKGYLTLHSEQEFKALKESLNSPYPVLIPSPLLNEAVDILEDYSEFRKHVQLDLKSSPDVSTATIPVRDDEGSDSEAEDDLRDSECVDYRRECHGMTGEAYEEPTPEQVRRRSLYLHEQLEKRQRRLSELQAQGRHCIKDVQDSLTIAKFKDQIVDAVQNNQVLIVSGDTGCGKSTQVPQWILDSWTSEMRSGMCNIVVTQPRRISAISLAKRVAEERLEELGESVGYQVRLDAVHPQGRPGGNILFCSSGIVLRRLQSSQYLSGVTHIIVDEAHMRDLQTDFLITLLKDVLPKRPDLKLLLMSASMNTELFHEYFDHPPLIHVPGNLFPVKPHYLEDCAALVPRHIPEVGHKPTVNLDYIISLIEALDQKKPAGAILCFLPGWQEIKTVWTRLESKWDSNSHWVIPVHSRLSNQQQSRMFETPPSNVRKVILATNIAETSITVNDVVYVVDSGVQREARYDPSRGVSSMGLQWSSKANITQRRGRAGRVMPGQSFHLFPERLLDSLPSYPIPEICCSHLAKLALDTKLYIKEGSIAEFLAKAPDPPPPDLVRKGVEELKTLNILDREENLTYLGKRVAHFTTLPAISKAIIYSALFRCVDPVLSISAVLSSGREPFSHLLENKAAVREMKARYHPSSDHLALAAIIKAYESSQINEFSDEMALLDRRQLKFLQGIKRIYSEHLYDAYLVESPADCFKESHPCNEMSGSSYTVLGALFAGLGSLLRVRSGVVDRGRIKWDETKLLTTDRQVVSIGGESVNYKDEGCDHRYLLYHGWFKSVETRQTTVKDTSPLSPIQLLLLGGSHLTNYQVSTLVSIGGESVNYEDEGCDHRYLLYHGWFKSVETRQTTVKDTSPLSPIQLLLLGGSHLTNYQVPTLVSIGGESVNYEDEGCDHRYLLYHGWFKSIETRQTTVKDTSPLSPIQLLLLGGSHLTNYQSEDDTNVLRMNGMPMLGFSCHSQTSPVIMNIRSALQETSEYLIKHQGLSEPSDLSRRVMDTHVQLLYLLLHLTEDISQLHGDKLYVH